VSGVLLDVRGVSKTYAGAIDGQRAVDGVSVSVAPGRTLGVVGESGSGKSTLARCVLRLTDIDDGQVLFDGQDVHALGRADLRRVRRRIQVVFQDPHGSLNRRQRVRDIVVAPLEAHGVGDRAARAARAAELVELVGLPQAFLERRPAELSGGQAQRVAIARALALAPELLVLDEAVSALDVSVQAQVLNLLKRLQDELGIAYLFISHDLAIVRYMCHDVAVMRRGAVVEHATREELFRRPQHEYTQALMRAVPVADPARERERRERARRLAGATSGAQAQGGEAQEG
jgi:peptide/nickel transport system ATP-binding protein